MRFLISIVILTMSSCIQDEIYLGGIQRVADVLMVPCNPYNTDSMHTCVIYAKSFSNTLMVYDATMRELVLAPNAYFPLKIKAGHLINSLENIKGDENFPYILALDNSKKEIIPVSTLGKNSFIPKKSLSLANGPFKMAAFKAKDQVGVILTYPDKSSIDINLLDAQLQKIEKNININLGKKPSHVAVDDKASIAVFTDETDNEIFLLELADIYDALNNNNKIVPKSIAINESTDRIFLAEQDLGFGKILYAIAFATAKNKIFLIDLKNRQLKADLDFKSALSAAYFPSDPHEECCEKSKNWLAVTDILGNFHYVEIASDSTSKFSLSIAKTINLKSARNLNLESLLVTKLVGGEIKPDPLGKKKTDCKRKIFIAPSYGSSHASLEVDANAYICEGEDSAGRLGERKN